MAVVMLPERKLFGRVLEAAIEDINVNDPVRNSRAWFKETGASADDLFAFETVCGVLGLDPAAVRESLRPFQRRKPMVRVVF